MKGDVVKNMRYLSNRLKLKRKTLGLTQKDIAVKLGVSAVAVSRWELGHNDPSEKVLRDLSQLLDCEPEWLLNGTTKVSDRCKEICFIPLYDVFASAGHGCINEENLTGEVAIPLDVVVNQCNKNELYCINVKGLSMTPVLNDGSVVAINPHLRKMKDGFMFLIRQGDLLRIKCIVETPEHIIVRSYNSEYDDEKYSKKNSNVDILGQVFWHSSSIKV